MFLIKSLTKTFCNKALILGILFFGTLGTNVGKILEDEKFKMVGSNSLLMSGTNNRYLFPCKCVYNGRNCLNSSKSLCHILKLSDCNIDWKVKYVHG